MSKLSNKILNWSNKLINFPDIPSTSTHYTDYLSSIKPAKVKLRSPEEDMQIVAKDIAKATAKTLAHYGDDYNEKGDNKKW